MPKTHTATFLLSLTFYLHKDDLEVTECGLGTAWGVVGLTRAQSPHFLSYRGQPLPKVNDRTILYSPSDMLPPNPRHLQSIKMSPRLDFSPITKVHSRVLNIFGHTNPFENLMEVIDSLARKLHFCICTSNGLYNYNGS